MRKQHILSCDFETTSLNRNDYKNDEDYQLALETFTPEVYDWVIVLRKNNVDSTKPDIDNYIVKYDIGIESFFDTIMNLDQDYTMYFHNGSKFDLHFLLPYLYKRGMKELVVQKNDLSDLSKFTFEGEYDNLTIVEKGRLLEFGEYSTLVDDGHKIMEMKIALPSKKGKKHRILTIRDTNLMFPSKLKDYGVSLNKQYKTDFFTKQEISYTRSEKYNSIEELQNDGNELSYLIMDGIILIEFIYMMTEILPFNKWKMTAAGTAYNIWKYDFFGKQLLEDKVKNGEIETFIPERSKGDYKLYRYKGRGKWKSSTSLINNLFDKVFPISWLDSFTIDGLISNFICITPSYQGGLTMANPDYAGKILYSIIYCDINSSYPDRMFNGIFPKGNPILTEPKDKSKYRILYNVYVKDAINSKGVPFLYDFVNGKSDKGKCYPKHIKNKKYILTDEELERVYKYYEGDISHEFLVAFETISGKEIFGKYIDYFYDLKAEGKEEGNVAKVIYAKLMLNSLYGKFGQDIERNSRIYVNGEWEQFSTISDPKFYFPLAIWITSYARMKIVDATGFNYHLNAYIDTDSISVLAPSDLDLRDKNKVKEYIESNMNMELDKTKLGAWDIEHLIYKMRTRRAKQYYFVDIDGVPHIKFAGLRISEWEDESKYSKDTIPKDLNKDLKRINFENFVYGIKGFYQLRPNRLPSGILLEEYEKQIKPIWEYDLNPSYWFSNEEEFKKGRKTVKITTN